MTSRKAGFDKSNPYRSASKVRYVHPADAINRTADLFVVFYRYCNFSVYQPALAHIPCMQAYSQIIRPARHLAGGSGPGRKPARHRKPLRRGGRVCILFNLRFMFMM